MISLIREYELGFGKLPNEPVSNQVIYVENGLNPEFGAFVERYLDKIKEMFRKEGLEFIYLKDWIKDITDYEFRTAAKYYVPWLKPEDLSYLRSASLIDINELGKKLTAWDADGAIVGSTGHAYKIFVRDSRLYREQLYQIAVAYGQERIRQEIKDIPVLYGPPPAMVAEEPLVYESTPNEPDYNKDAAPWDDGLTRKFKQLRKLLPEWVIRAMIDDKLLNQDMLSSIRIDHRCVLTLPEYDIEISLRPLEMAFYLLFLKHPEGIEFKKMIDHRDELLGYYYQYANKGTREEQAQTIDKLLEPLNYDDRNTQRSRIQIAINDAFRDRFCERYAQYYIIEGVRNAPKFIKIAKENKLRLEVDL